MINHILWILQLMPHIYTVKVLLFNFGHIKIEKEKYGKYHFIYNVIDSNNRIRPNSTINLIPK